MNQTPEPITGPGILWAINQINQRFDKAMAKPAPEVEQEEAEQAEALEELNR